MKDDQRESYTELLTILSNMEIEYQKMVPEKLISFFERNCAKDYKFDIDLDIPLKEQKLKNRTVSLLAMLNLNYWCTSEEKKQELIKKYSENEKRNQEELMEKYNSNNIFKNNVKSKNTIQDNVVAVEDNINNEIVKYKESIFKKIINWVKTFIH